LTDLTLFKEKGMKAFLFKIIFTLLLSLPLYAMEMDPSERPQRVIIVKAKKPLTEREIKKWRQKLRRINQEAKARRLGLPKWQ